MDNIPAAFFNPAAFRRIDAQLGIINILDNALAEVIEQRRDLIEKHLDEIVLIDDSQYNGRFAQTSPVHGSALLPVRIISQWCDGEDETHLYLVEMFSPTPKQIKLSYKNLRAVYVLEGVPDDMDLENLHFHISDELEKRGAKVYRRLD
jgi:hypothetical protein